MEGTAVQCSLLWIKYRNVWVTFGDPVIWHRTVLAVLGISACCHFVVDALPEWLGHCWSQLIVGPVCHSFSRWALLGVSWDWLRSAIGPGNRSSTVQNSTERTRPVWDLRLDPCRFCVAKQATHHTGFICIFAEFFFGGRGTIILIIL